MLHEISHRPTNSFLRLPLRQLEACAKNAVESYEAGGPRALQDQKPDCYHGILLSSQGVVLADPHGRKLSPIELDRVDFDVAALVDEACADASLEAQQLSKSVIIVRREQFHLHGHRDLLRRAIDNVLRNGLRFAQTDGCIQVSYFCKHEPSRGIILIQDDGPGISAGQEEAIFEPFVTLPNGDSEAKAAGSGLGLAIARQAVLANDGRISAKSGADGGLAVTIDLPVAIGSV